MLTRRHFAATMTTEHIETVYRCIWGGQFHSEAVYRWHALAAKIHIQQSNLTIACYISFYYERNTKKFFHFCGFFIFFRSSLKVPFFIGRKSGLIKLTSAVFCTHWAIGIQFRRFAYPPNVTFAIIKSLIPVPCWLFQSLLQWPVK